MDAEEIAVEKDKPRCYFEFGFESHSCWDPGNYLVSDMKERSYLSPLAISAVFLSPHAHSLTSPKPCLWSENHNSSVTFDKHA